MSAIAARNEGAIEWARFVADVDRLVEDLVNGYLKLPSVKVPARASIGDGMPSGTGDVHAAAPLDLGVVDLLVEVDSEVDRLVGLMLGTLRRGLTAASRRRRDRAARTVEGLRALGGAVRAVWETDPSTGAHIVDALWDLRGKVRAYTADGPRTYRTALPCVACGEGPIVVDTRKRRARCVACGSSDQAHQEANQ